MAPLYRIEPIGGELLDIEPEASQLIDKIGWRNVFGNFDGHKFEVNLGFTLFLKDNIEHIGNLTLIIYEYFVAKASQLPQIGEKMFNRGEVDTTKCKQFLLPLPTNYDDKFGYSMKFLKPR